ncbi:BTB POZ domain-containing adapter for CUL3-mediated degradation 3 [Chlorella sorokiniana]|uniref:BTB POZ domain-containing adapter for CUL3-mediated degradation 3 n=1 Tax=Chlorella sorokiniana TaxID=3076 RepID=A0A2P6TD79_CHLSO|nr:BTB POZ domain-containing adapter for CUL3-mediated degradation 3 [Chlorella sorokiniana]|eukprot:PRW20592.1 BTB POZ domain-containing adapter for CUL3-mediated degradation 3 [Chlorella sorokiniana]
MAASDELITLNVGGTLFRTTHATLTKHPDSMLAAMFRGDMQASALRDEQGHPFLDRNPTHFALILDYLRDGRVPPLPSSLLELQQLKVEAEFFAMAELAEAAGAAATAVQAGQEAQQRLAAERAAAVQATSEAWYKVYAVEQELRFERNGHKMAARRLRDALLARLCALGANLPAAEAQLRATHPELDNRNL